MSTPRRLADLDSVDRRRALARSVAVITGSWVAILGAYALLPFDDRYDRAALIWLLLVLAVLAVATVLLVRMVLRSRLPELSAIEALLTVIPIYLSVFAGLYLSLASDDRANFSQPLTHTSAMYFAITVLSTVGFGDITPATDVARIVVSVQMLLNVVLIAAGARLLLVAVKNKLAEQP